jgi:hypothetical protein
VGMSLSRYSHGSGWTYSPHPYPLTHA